MPRDWGEFTQVQTVFFALHKIRLYRSDFTAKSRLWVNCETGSLTGSAGADGALAREITIGEFRSRIHVPRRLKPRGGRDPRFDEYHGRG